MISLQESLKEFGYPNASEQWEHTCSKQQQELAISLATACLEDDGVHLQVDETIVSDAPFSVKTRHVPKKLDLAKEFSLKEDIDPPTTLMIRNIPNTYTQTDLIAELDGLGFAGTFDFLYIPMDMTTMANQGYAFVNFVVPHDAAKCMHAFQDFRFRGHRRGPSRKVAAVSVAHIQGLEANLRHYQNAAVRTAKLRQRRPVVMVTSNMLSYF